MALDKVFVSPGVYTSERDLSFVTSNVGVTTLGLVGELTQGPAFQPIFVSNYTEFKTFFGGLNPKKIKDTGALQYELPYIAKSYLNNSNQLYVTRVLGLSGYDAGIAYELKLGDKVVAVLRSRAKYAGDTLTFDVAKESASTVSASGTGNSLTLYIDMTEVAVVSLDKTKTNYITKKLGTTPQDKTEKFYVEEIYPQVIDANITLDDLTEAASGNYFQEYKNAKTPFIVSEAKGLDKADKLFRFHTISDGEASNEQVKVSIVNIKPDLREFDVVVRAFHDTDANPVQLERFAKCNMNPASDDFIGRKIGDVEGDYVSRSSYILVEMAPNSEASVDSFPAGFEGYPVRDELAYGVDSMYKVSYDTYENKRRTYLGVTDGFDKDLLKFKGFEQNHATFTKGFHMDKDMNGDNFVADTNQEFKSETQLTDGYKELYARTFTVVPFGGFDGWDAHRTNRTNTNNYTFQWLDKDNKVLEDTAFRPIADINGDRAVSSDYYAFLKAIRTFSNPESVNINVFATPGIDTINNDSLVEATIEMVERERSDSLYIVTTPDMSSGEVMTAKQIAAELDGKFDSNYTATYWPWVQKNDPENNVLVYLPPTADVVRNIALTDNVAHPWYAVAGFLRGDVKAVKARVKLTQQDRDVLYEARINPIATFSGEGIKIFGNKNLQIKDSSLNRVNVRRLLLQTRKLISAVSIRLVFDQNDDTLRNDFLRQVNPILENIRRERGLNDFKVELVDSPEARDRNTLTGKIKIKPTNALEFIEVQFDVMSTGASFEDL
jgi:hypothetical protein